MTKYTPSPLVNLQNETTAVTNVNNNYTAISTAMENTLSRDGTVPNSMGADLDMNAHRILNLPAAGSANEPVRQAEFLLGVPGPIGPAGPAGTNGTNGTNGTVYPATSTTSLLIGTGSKVFTTQAGLGYLAGTRVHAASAANVANFMDGSVTSYAGTTLTVNVDKIGGSGTFADWNINLSGVPGTDGVGSGDVLGPASSTTNAFTRFSSTTGKAIKDSATTTMTDTGVVTGMVFPNTGLQVQDTNASHNLTLKPGSDITAARTLTFTTGDSDRILTISGNPSISQDTTTTGNPQFATIELGAATDTTLGRTSAGVINVEGITVPLNSLTVSAVHTANTIELGHATDTTISRDSAGVIAIEGVPLFSNIPQNSKSTAYTTVLSDAQKHILHPSADTTARTWTIDSNANVAYPIGTAITFVNQNAGGVITIAITSDTMRLAGLGTTGNRSLAANGIATALKVTATEWIISGTGLT